MNTHKGKNKTTKNTQESRYYLNNDSNISVWFCGWVAGWLYLQKEEAKVMS